MPVETCGRIRLNACRKALKANHFHVFIADDPVHAGKIILNQILPEIDFTTVSWGDSLTFYDTRVLDVLKARPEVKVIQTFDTAVSRKEIIERRRQALLVDLFFTGTNAVTETGKLVNLDMVGNRVAAVTFGPTHVIILVGRNKIVSNIGDGMQRIKEYAAPANAIRHDFRTPCTKTAICMDCNTPQRICNTWTVTERSYPEGRIKVILINKDLGL